jgi:hypothetical protein
VSYFTILDILYYKRFLGQTESDGNSQCVREERNTAPVDLSCICGMLVCSDFMWPHKQVSSDCAVLSWNSSGNARQIRLADPETLEMEIPNIMHR